MKALAATLDNLLLIDLETRKIQIIETHRRNYYGISWWEDSEHPILSHSVVTRWNPKTLDDYAATQGYLSCGETQISPNMLISPHQIFCTPNGWVITTNTGRNRITIFDSCTGFVKDLMINNINWDHVGDDRCGEHFNSVFVKNNRMYILAHGLKKYSYVLEYSFPECQLLSRYEIPKRTGLHNIWINESGRMISCHSAAGELIDIKSGETLWSGSAFFSRGLAVTSDLIVVGDSEIAMRDDRVRSQSGLWLIDRKSMRTIDYIPLGSVGSLHEVRILDVPDEAHHGKVFKHMDKLCNIDYMQYRREQKLRSYERLNGNPFSKSVNFILGNAYMNEDQWLVPRYEHPSQAVMLAMAKKKPQKDFTLTIDYAFQSTNEEQNFSLITGYKGNHDHNMVAIFVHYTSKKVCHLYLMKNINGKWEPAELLAPIVDNEGKLEVRKKGNQLRIKCTGSASVEKTLSSLELEGDVGVRCQGSQFRNFSMVEA